MRSVFLLLACLLGTPAPAQARMPAEQGQFEVVPQEPPTRWHAWISEGPIDVVSGNQSYWGNRFRLGVEYHAGEDQQWIFGLTVLDFISSGEATVDVGGVSRGGGDLTVGYFLLPKRLWFSYSLHWEIVSGSRIANGESALGHQLSAGYRFLTAGQFNLAAELSTLYVYPADSTFIELSTGQPGSTTFPSALIWGLTLRAGFDFGV